MAQDYLPVTWLAVSKEPQSTNTGGMASSFLHPPQDCWVKGCQSLYAFISPMPVQFPKTAVGLLLVAELGWNSDVLLGFTFYIRFFICLLNGCLHRLANDCFDWFYWCQYWLHFVLVELLSVESWLRYNQWCKKERTALGSSWEWTDCARRFALFLSEYFC